MRGDGGPMNGLAALIMFFAGMLNICYDNALSNTGGQKSKATHQLQPLQILSGWEIIPQKRLGMMQSLWGMSRSQVLANSMQTIKQLTKRSVLRPIIIWLYPLY